MKICQEFFCGECETYMHFPLNINLNQQIKIECPSCKHIHDRYIKDGLIYEKGRECGTAIETIKPMKSSCSKKPFTQKMHDAKSNYQKRDGVPLERDEFTKEVIRQSWAERFGNRV